MTVKVNSQKMAASVVIQKAKSPCFTRQRKNRHAHVSRTRRGLGQAYHNVREETRTDKRSDHGNDEPLDEGNSDEEGVDPDEAACK